MPYTEWVHKFHISYVPVTLNESQGHSNWHKNVHLGRVYYHIKLEKKKKKKKRFLRAWMQNKIVLAELSPLNINHAHFAWAETDKHCMAAYQISSLLIQKFAM